MLNYFVDGFIANFEGVTAEESVYKIFTSAGHSGYTHAAKTRYLGSIFQATIRKD